MCNYSCKNERFLLTSSLRASFIALSHLFFAASICTHKNHNRNTCGLLWQLEIIDSLLCSIVLLLTSSFEQLKSLFFTKYVVSFKSLEHLRSMRLWGGLKKWNTMRLLIFFPPLAKSNTRALTHFRSNEIVDGNRQHSIPWDCNCECHKLQTISIVPLESLPFISTFQLMAFWSISLLFILLCVFVFVYLILLSQWS